MGTEAIPAPKLRIFFFPYITSGHFFPMLDLAANFSSSAVSSTVITTPSNAHLVPSNLSLLLLPLPEPPSSPLPPGWDSVSSPSSHPNFHAIHSSLSLLRQPLLSLLSSRHPPPHCLVSDMFLPWTADVAAALRIPRVVFHGMSSFSLSAIASIKNQLLHHRSEHNEDLVVPGLPRPVVMARSQLPGPLRGGPTSFDDVMAEVDESVAKSYGVVVNSFYELEAGFGEHYRRSLNGLAWLVGPVSLCNNHKPSSTIKGKDEEWLGWLDGKTPNSVIYVCFGSQAEFSPSQLGELGRGLMSSEHSFIWVVRSDSPEIWLEREGSGKGLIIRGWAPQVRILSHGSVGGFLTHCGWNSVLEGVAAGKPMVTWPVFGDQPFNEKLVVDELGVGVRVGARIVNGDEEEVAAAASLVKGEEVARAVERVMGGGEEAAEMRRRAEKLGEAARAAVMEGGSSWKDVNRLIQDIRNNIKE